MFCISYEVKSISGAAENAGEVPVTRVLGIKLASVQRHEVVSHQLFCIFIICQCDEVSGTKRRRRRRNRRRRERGRFLGKHVVRAGASSSPCPRHKLPFHLLCPQDLDFVPPARFLLAQIGLALGQRVKSVAQKSRLSF